MEEKEIKIAEKNEEKPEIKEETKKPEKEIKKKDIKKTKKTEAIVNGKNISISTKKAVAICKFIKGKKIENAIKDLEQVIILKKAIPMVGEIPHRKGKIGPGRYPQKTAKYFIILLKSLAANASDLEEPIICEAIPNMASRPYGRFGRIRKKRTHIKIIARERNTLKKLKRNKISSIKKTLVKKDK